MNLKVILGILLGIVIIVFVVFSLNWKTGETASQVEFSQSNQVKTDIIDTNTDRMMAANAQAGAYVAQGKKPMIDASKAPSEYIASGYKESETPKEPLKIDRTYSIKGGDYFGCSNPYLLRRLLNYAAAYEKAKFARLMDKGLKANDCITFKRGEVVKLIDVSKDGNEVNVSRFGDSGTWWTPAVAIQ